MAMNKKKFKAAAFAHALEGLKKSLKAEAKLTQEAITFDAEAETLPTYITRCQIAINKLNEALDDLVKGAEIKDQLDGENQ